MLRVWDLEHSELVSESEERYSWCDEVPHGRIGLAMHINTWVVLVEFWHGFIVVNSYDMGNILRCCLGNGLYLPITITKVTYK